MRPGIIELLTSYIDCFQNFFHYSKRAAGYACMEAWREKGAVSVTRLNTASAFLQGSCLLGNSTSTTPYWITEDSKHGSVLFPGHQPDNRKRAISKIQMLKETLIPVEIIAEIK